MSHRRPAGERSLADRVLCRFVAPYRPRSVIADRDLTVLLLATTPQQEEVVLKIPNPDFAVGRSASSRAAVEALKHEGAWLEAVRRKGIPGVVRLIDDRSADPLPFLAMERVEGESLSEIVGVQELTEADGTPMIRDCLAFLRETARTVSALHAAGLFHYDIKPGNIMKRGAEYVLIDPAPATAYTPGFGGERIRSSSDRDVAALAYCAMEVCFRETEIQELPLDFVLVDKSGLAKLLRRMLGETGEIPPARVVARQALALARKAAGDSQPRGAGTRPRAGAA